MYCCTSSGGNSPKDNAVVECYCGIYFLLQVQQ